MFQHILIATDGSPLSDEGVSKGLAFAKALGAKVTILTVIEPFYAVSADVADVELHARGVRQDGCAAGGGYAARGFQACGERGARR